MNIWIETEALNTENKNSKSSETPFWPGTLYGLKRLDQAGHKLGFDTDHFNELQHQLLDQEQVPNNRCSRSEADVIVGVQDQQLQLLTTDDEVRAEQPDWIQLSELICFPHRTAELKRKTGETDISIKLNLDGTGKSSISTGIPFFDHMLDQIARHGLVDLDLTCNGDLEVDEHHTIEDVGIALGEAIAQALGDKRGIQRYSSVLPMDETKAMVALDLSGRPYLVFNGSFNREYVGDFPTEMVEHFFYSLTMNLKATLHIDVEGKNEHHKIEACFKGFARALRASITRSERTQNLLPSSKGVF